MELEALAKLGEAKSAKPRKPPVLVMLCESSSCLIYSVVVEAGRFVYGVGLVASRKNRPVVYTDGRSTLSLSLSRLSPGRRSCPPNHSTEHPQKPPPSPTAAAKEEAKPINIAPP